jgi:hypothetical protein
MIELYFIFYYVPKTMSRLARERGRSRLAWSLIGIGAWLGAEFAIGTLFALIQLIGVLWWDWPEEMSLGLTAATYICALGGAIGSFVLVLRVLKSRRLLTDLPVPPAPPDFSKASTAANN